MVYILSTYERFGEVKELVSQAEFARRIGRTRQYVSKLVKQGKLTLCEKKIDVKAANGVLKEIEDPRRKEQRKKNSKAKTSATPKPASSAATPKAKDEKKKAARIPKFSVSLAKKEFWKAEREEMLTLELGGSLVRAEDVERQGFKSSRDARDAIFEVFPRIAKQLAAMTDPYEIVQLGNRELRQSMVELAKGDSQLTTIHPV